MPPVNLEKLISSLTILEKKLNKLETNLKTLTSIDINQAYSDFLVKEIQNILLQMKEFKGNVSRKLDELGEN